VGANPTQALALLVFLIGFVLISCSLFIGGNMVLLLAGIVALAVAGGIFLKAKPMEQAEE